MIFIDVLSDVWVGEVLNLLVVTFIINVRTDVGVTTSNTSSDVCLGVKIDAVFDIGTEVLND